MRIATKLSFVFVFFLTSIQIAYAMDDEINKFVTIDQHILAQMKGNAPSHQHWQSGQNNIWHFLAWAHYKSGQEMKESLDVTDQFGFQTYIPPFKLCEFAQARIPSNFDYQVNFESTDTLEPARFAQIVARSIKNKTPLIVYTKNENAPALVTIVGYRVVGDVLDEVLVLDIEAQGKRTLKPTKFATLFERMNVSSLAASALIKSQLMEETEQAELKKLALVISENLKTYNLMFFKPHPTTMMSETKATTTTNEKKNTTPICICM